MRKEYFSLKSEESTNSMFSIEEVMRFYDGETRMNGRKKESLDGREFGEFLKEDFKRAERN